MEHAKLVKLTEQIKELLEVEKEKILSAAIAFTFKSTKKLNKKEKINISLSELSSIWVKYNELIIEDTSLRCLGDANV